MQATISTTFQQAGCVARASFDGGPLWHNGWPLALPAQGVRGLLFTSSAHETAPLPLLVALPAGLPAAWVAPIAALPWCAPSSRSSS